MPAKKNLLKRPGVQKRVTPNRVVNLWLPNASVLRTPSVIVLPVLQPCVCRQNNELPSSLNDMKSSVVYFNNPSSATGCFS